VEKSIEATVLVSRMMVGRVGIEPTTFGSKVGIRPIGGNQRQL